MLSLLKPRPSVVSEAGWNASQSKWLAKQARQSFNVLVGQTPWLIKKAKFEAKQTRQDYYNPLNALGKAFHADVSAGASGHYELNKSSKPKPVRGLR